MRHRVLATALCLGLSPLVAGFAPAPAFADDRSYLTALLEDNLSGAGRKVTITGFAGALSSRATMTQLTIADDQGVWLQLDNVVLDWSRTALLSGAFIVNELAADSIRLERLPARGEDSSLPSAEASAPFQLPELPVSVDIGKISAPRIELGAAVLGEDVVASLEAQMHLRGGDGTGHLVLERTDAGSAAKVTLGATYSNATSQLVLNLDASEAAGGLVARALDLPGHPATRLALTGEGALTDFAARFALESDGAPRLSGPITIKTGEQGETVFSGDLAGNPAPLFLPEYADFLGNNLTLQVSGTRWADGRLELQALDLASRALNLRGRLALAADGLPSLIDVTGAMALPDGQAVLLPISGPVQTRVGRADLELKFDAQSGNHWTLDLDLRGLDRSDLAMDRLALRGTGIIDRQDGKRVVSGALDLVGLGLARLEPGLLAAIGRDVTGQVQFDWTEGSGALNLTQLQLKGQDYGAEGTVSLHSLGQEMTADGRLKVDAADLSRFSALAGQPLAGIASFTVSGQVVPLTGAFDAELALRGQGLRIGQPEVDRLLSGVANVSASVRRDTTGTQLRAFEARAASLAVTASGTLSSAQSALTGRIDWRNLSDLGAGYGGRLTADAAVNGNLQDARLTLKGETQDLRIGQPEVDRLVSGQGNLRLEGALRGGAPRLVSLDLTAPNVTAQVAGVGNDGALRVSGRLRDLALLVENFPGPVTLAGTVTPRGAEFVTDLRVQGPGGIDARLAGQVTGTPDLRISGTGTAALANAFTDPVSVQGALSYDLRLQGGWALDRLSGRATLANGGVALPARGLSLKRVEVAANLAGGSVRLTATADTPPGGRLRVSGPVGLTGPYVADLQILLEGVKLRDPELYDTQFAGDLTLRGGLLGAAQLAGVVTLGETELRVPSTGFATAADLETVRHVNDSAAVRATRVRAGVGQNPAGAGGAASSGGGLNWGVDLTVRAPQRVFVRGRGLDAELGGEIRLGGTLANLVPSGGLELIRGRLDILGRRLTLTEASLVLEGDFNPYLTVRASNTADAVTSIVTISGTASAPEVTFTSDPELPQEEVLAWLLFGRGLDQISAFQAAQLANAVATLAGRGGVGIVGRLRQGFGFDDLDVSTNENGQASVKAGKYIADNLYTEIGVDQQGQTQINLNLDLRPGVTVKGSVRSNGDSGLGLFLEKDY